MINCPVMTIARLQISNLRIFEQLVLEPAAGINLICGSNGSGKTSLLEAIYILGKGKSFRSNRVQSVIREGAPCLEVVAWRAGQHQLVAGIRRCTHHSEIRINGQTVDKLSELARQFPVQLITPRSHELIERGPDVRRRFLDWALFHVEPGYQDLISKYQRILKQRNGALRASPKEVQIWDRQLCETAESLTLLRRNYVDRLQERVTGVLIKLGVDLDIRIRLYDGWARGTDLAMQLKDRLKQDVNQGFTGLGAHRADLQFRVGNKAAAERLSRGQQKLLVLALVIAELELVASQQGRDSLLLVDDIAAELDTRARQRAIELLADIRCQVFVSALDPGQLENMAADRVFHVEQGGQLS